MDKLVPLALFVIILTAFDCIQPGFGASPTVYCNEIDIDNDSEISCFLSEADPIGYVILKFSKVTNEYINVTDVPDDVNNSTYYVRGSGTNLVIKNEIDVDGSTDLRAADVLKVEVLYSNITNNNINSITVSMTLLAINDNEPKFKESRYDGYRLNELALPGSKIDFNCEDEKTDEDLFSPSFSITSSCVILEPDNPPFEFEDGNVTVNSTLDFERYPTYTLIIQITEVVEGEPKVGGNTTLVITVVDGDDLNPAFEEIEYELDVPENQTDWSADNIIAYDQDYGINATLTYSFRDSSEYFSIDPDTGNITMNLIIDREITPTLDPLIVKATQVDNYQRVGSARIVFNVVDANDSCPMFKYPSYTGYVYELSNVSQPVAAYGTMGNLSITASDPDEVFIGEFTAESDEFELEVSDSDISSAIIKVKDNTNLNCSMYEGCNKTFESVITLTDGSCTSTSYVSITLVEINDHDPVMEPTYYVNVQENTIYESIIQINATDVDSGLDGQIDYSIVSAYANFDINSNTGEIYLEDTLDAETSTEYRLVIQACDKAEIFQRRCTFADVEVFVEDVNEYSPVFLNDEFNISVYENEHCTTVFTAMASDNDVTGKLSYIIGPGSDDFSIDGTTGDVQLLHTLDREVTPIYNLMIYVSDGENTAVCNLTVVVEDANDNYPDVNSHFYFEIQENSLAGSTTISIDASDEDVKENKALTYHIYDSSLSDLFSLDPDSGIFTTNQEMDRENQSSYNVIVIVRDNSTELPLYNLTMVEVDITDVNDNPPIIDSPLCGSDVHVTEGLTRVLLGQIYAYDNDEPGSLNAEILYELVSETDALSYFQIDGSTGEISTTETPINREERSEFLLNVTASNPISCTLDTPCEDYCVIYVTVDDVNDEKPRFATEFKDEYVMNEEDAVAGVTIFEFSATDEDVYPNNIVIFNITEESGHHFYIENDIAASTGKVKISDAPASYDESYAITIGVYNIDDTQLINGNRSTVEVRILPQSPYRISILPIENVTVYEYETGNVTTIYVDTEGNIEDVAYNITQTFANDTVSDEIPSSAIAVDKNQLILNSSAIGRYVVNVTAYNSSMPSINDVTTVYIIVLSSENTDPVFNNNKPEIISSDVKPETVIFTLTATDDDYPEFGNGEILFDITNENSGLDETLFSIDPSTGEISLLLSPLEIALLTGYPASSITVSVDVLVYDLSIVRGSDNATLEFRIQLPNPGPNITHVPPHFELQEEQDGAYLFTVTAVDENPPVLFTLDGSGSKHFSIDADGKVSSNRKFDSEKGDISFEIVVIVTDQSGLKDYAVVPVTILDINDNPPIFTESFIFEVKEDAETQTTVGQVYAIDEDIGLTNFTNRVKYKLREYSLYFEINADTGVIQTKGGQLDRENNDSFNLTIVAFNDMPSYLNKTFDTETNVSINIIDVNDNSPVFDKESYETFFTSFVKGTKVLTIHAVDRDKGYNGMVVYSLSAEDSSLEFFTINKTTGVITNIKTLSSEEINELPEIFSMVAYAVDQGSPPQSDEVIVDILVALPDQPIFKEPDPEDQTLEIEEGKPGEAISFPPATLSDEYALDGNVTYTITGGTGFDYFCIPDPLVNALMPIGELNREDNANYTLLISAGFCNNSQDQCSDLTSDCETGRRAEIKQATTFEKHNTLWHNPSDTVLNRNEILLIILIEDVNDDAPTIEDDSRLNIDGYSAGVRDDAEYGYEVFQVQANDNDVTSELLFTMSPDDGDTPFTINPLTGQVFVKGLLYEEIDYSDPQESWPKEFNYKITVNDTSTLKGNNTDTTNARIYILSRFEHILLIFNNQAEEVKHEQGTIVQNLEDNFGMKIIVESISPRTEYFPLERDASRSEMMIYALANNTGTCYNYEDFKDITSCDREGIDGVDNCTIVPIKKIYSTQNDILGLVLVIFTSLIFVGSCILIYLVIYSFEEYEQSRRNNVLRESRMTNHTNAAINSAYINDEVNDIYKIPLDELSSSTVDEVGQETAADNTENDELPISNIYESMEDISELMNDGNDKISDGFDPYNIDWDSAIVPKTPNGTRKTTVARVYVNSSKLSVYKSSNDADSGILINEEDKSNEDKSANREDKPDADQEDNGLGSEEYEEPLVIAPGTIEGGTEETLVEEDHEVFKKAPEKTEPMDHTCIDISGAKSDDGGDIASTDFTSISMTPTGEDENPKEHVDNKKVRFQADVTLDDISESESMTAL